MNPTWGVSMSLAFGFAAAVAGGCILGQHAEHAFVELVDVEPHFSVRMRTATLSPFAHDGEKDVFGSDEILAHSARFRIGKLQNPLRARGVLNVLGLSVAPAEINSMMVWVRAGLIDIVRGEDGGGDAGSFLHKSPQDVFGADVAVSHSLREILREVEGCFRLFCKFSVDHGFTSGFRIGVSFPCVFVFHPTIGLLWQACSDRMVLAFFSDSLLLFTVPAPSWIPAPDRLGSCPGRPDAGRGRPSAGCWPGWMSSMSVFSLVSSSPRQQTEVHAQPHVGKLLEGFLRGDDPGGPQDAIGAGDAVLQTDAALLEQFLPKVPLLFHKSGSPGSAHR